MVISSDEIRTLISVGALGLSFASVLFSIYFWKKSNRPIVIAFVEEGDRSVDIYNLVVTNTGNRPAVRVRLHASEKDIEKLFEDGTDPKRIDETKYCFSQKGEIPILKNGEELKTALGAITIKNRNNGKWLNYEAETNIKITYNDLEGNKYTSFMPIKIYPRTGFGGSYWK